MPPPWPPGPVLDCTVSLQNVTVPDQMKIPPPDPPPPPSEVLQYRVSFPRVTVAEEIKMAPPRPAPGLGDPLAPFPKFAPWASLFWSVSLDSATLPPATESPPPNASPPRPAFSTTLKLKNPSPPTPPRERFPEKVTPVRLAAPPAIDTPAGSVAAVTTDAVKAAFVAIVQKGVTAVTAEGLVVVDHRAIVQGQRAVGPDAAA